MLWLFYCLSLLFKICPKACSCCGFYIFYHYSFRFDRGVIHVVFGYIVYHYCLRFNRRVVHGVVVILSTITVKGLPGEWFMFWLIILSIIAV